MRINPSPNYNNVIETFANIKKKKQFLLYFKMLHLK